MYKRYLPLEVVLTQRLSPEGIRENFLEKVTSEQSLDRQAKFQQVMMLGEQKMAGRNTNVYKKCGRPARNR